MGITIKEALIEYSNKIMSHLGFFKPYEYKDVPAEMIAGFQRNYLIPRTTLTDLEPFRERFGYELPQDIKDYINLYWHSYISGAYDCYKQGKEGGYYKFDEGPILFSVLKHEGETDNDVLFHKYGIYELTAEFYDDYDDEAEYEPVSAELAKEARKYICIGWTGYAAHAVLYKISTGEIYLQSWREDKVADDKPIAGSLAELISKIYFII